MAAFPSISLHASPSSSRIVIVIFSHPSDMHGFGAVVGVNENQSLLVDPQFGDKIEYLTDQGVELTDEIPPRPCLSDTSELRCRQDGSVAYLRRKHREERRFRGLPSMLDDKLPHLFEEQQICLDEFVSWGHPPSIVVPSPFASGVGKFRRLMSPVSRNLSIFNIDVKWIRRRTVWSDERLVEASHVGTINKWRAFFIVNQLRSLKTATELLAVFIKPSEAHMPFSEDTGVISFFLEHVAKSERARLEETRATGAFKRRATSTC